MKLNYSNCVPKINRIKIIDEIALLNLISQIMKLVQHTNTGIKIGVGISAQFYGSNKMER